MIFLQTAPEIATLFERLGIPVAILVAMGLFLWRGVWPYIKDRADKQDSLLKEQFVRIQNQQDTTLKEIAAALQAAGRTQERVEEHLKTLTEQLKKK